MGDQQEPSPQEQQEPSPEVQIIQQIQCLMVVCQLLPQAGKMREVIQLSLALHEESVLSGIQPITDLSPGSLQNWLQELWGQDGIAPEEQALIDWQLNADNIKTAVAELQEVENKTGLKIIPTLA